MKQKALISTSHVRDDALANYALNIVDNMTNNPNFTDPKPTLSVVKGLITLYSAALLQSIDGSKADTANKNACRVNLADSISTLANYVNLTSVNDLVKLESSGFNVSKVSTPVGILDAPILQISFGNNPGEINYTIISDSRATDHIILFSPIPAPINAVISSFSGVAICGSGKRLFNTCLFSTSCRILLLALTPIVVAVV